MSVPEKYSSNIFRAHREPVRSIVNASLGFYARFEWVLHLGHFRDEVSVVAQRVFRVTAGQNDPGARMPSVQTRDHIMNIEVVITQSDVDFIEQN